MPVHQGQLQLMKLFWTDAGEGRGLVPDTNAHGRETARGKNARS